MSLLLLRARSLDFRTRSLRQSMRIFEEFLSGSAVGKGIDVELDGKSGSYC